MSRKSSGNANSQERLLPLSASARMRNEDTAVTLPINVLGPVSMLQVFARPGNYQINVGWVPETRAIQMITPNQINTDPRNIYATQQPSTSQAPRMQSQESNRAVHPANSQTHYATQRK